MKARRDLLAAGQGRNRVRPRGRPSRFIWVGATAALALGLTGCDSTVNSSDTDKVNGSIHVAQGKPAKSVSTVNGSIHLDDNAAVTAANTVNGGIHLGAHATATSLKTVNGSIILGPDAKVSGEASSVNGDLSLKDGAELTGRLSNVSGTITIQAAKVDGGIDTVSGNISVTGTSHVSGGIHVGKSSGGPIHFDDTPRIVIGPGATVEGELRFERKVELLVSTRATIGPVSGATATPFAGDTP